VNIQQLLAIIRLRWRMSFNQWRKAGKVTVILNCVFLGLAAVVAVVGFFISVFAGNAILGQLEPIYLMFIFDGIVAVFLFVWMISLLAELQRSELLSLGNLLHLPVSLSGAFVLNYFSSWASLTMLFFLPVLLGLCIALPLTHGSKMLVVLPLVAGFLVMVTSVTYQFRGWLARLMKNKRRRGTVIAIMTIGVITLSQLPQLFNILHSRNRSKSKHPAWAKLVEREDVELRARADDEGLSEVEFENLQIQARTDRSKRRNEESEDNFRDLLPFAVLSNAAFPPGWLPSGVRSAANGNVLPAVFCSVGMFLIGGCSLSMSYRSTLLSYTGADNHRPIPAVAEVGQSPTAEFKGSIIERTIPFTSSQTSVIALSSLRSLIRAPESKMAMILPFVFLGTFGAIAFSKGSIRIPEAVRPLIALAAYAMVMFGLAQFVINMFGLDRNGFKSYVMMPVERRRVLLGKNLSLLPLLVSMALLMLVAMQIVVPMSFAHFVASIVQGIAIFPGYLMLGNYVSTICPVAMSFGSMKPTQPKIGTIILQALFVFLTPLLVLPAGIAFAIEFGLHRWLGIQWLPIYLLLSIAEAGLMLWVYSLMLKAQGEFLQKREQKILAVVVSKNE
jgi:ABC-2 type transport system permease protein